MKVDYEAIVNHFFITLKCCKDYGPCEQLIGMEYDPENNAVILTYDNGFQDAVELPQKCSGLEMVLRIAKSI